MPFLFCCFLRRLHYLDGLLPAGDLDYLNQADLTALQLPHVALDTMFKCMQSGLCRPPITLEFPDAVSNPQLPIKV